MTAKQKRVVIIGGGCGGWWIAYELVRRGILCTIIDMHPFAAYASTRNQGWLHSGAFYATLGDALTAQTCQRGYHFIRYFDPEAIHAKFPCYFLFQHEGELQDAVIRCNELGIEAQPVPIGDVKSREPILQGTRLGYAAEVWDRPIDTSRLLQKVADEACGMGALYRIVSSLDTIMPTWDGDSWQVSLDHSPDIRCKAIVLACGTYIPEMLGQLIPGQVPNFKRTKIPVLVMNGNVANSMLITPRAPGGPNLVPFLGKEGNGATVCLRDSDEEIANPSNDELPPDHLQRHAESLSDYYGGFKTVVSQGNPIKAHFYVCQKLVLSNAAFTDRRSHMLLTRSPALGAPENIFTFYPGKFTAAPIAAKMCADRLENLLGDPMVRKTRTLATPDIATQRYYTTHEYNLTVKGGTLFFDPIS